MPISRRRPGGEVTVRGYHGGELGAGPVEQYVRVLQGAADMAWGLPGYTSSQFGKTMIAELTRRDPDDKPGYEALWAAFDDHLAAEFPGTKALRSGPRNPTFSSCATRSSARRPISLA